MVCPRSGSPRWRSRVSGIALAAIVIALMFLPWVYSPAASMAESAADSPFASGAALSASVQGAQDMYATWFQTAALTGGGQNAVEMFAGIFSWFWIASLAIMVIGLVMVAIGTHTCRKIAAFAFVFAAVFSLSWIVFVYIADSMTGLPFVCTGWVVAELVAAVLGAGVATASPDASATCAVSKLSLAVTAYLAIMLVLLFLPWSAISGTAIDQASSSNYMGVQISTIAGALGGFLTMPYLGAVSIYLFQLSSGATTSIVDVLLGGFGAVPYDLLGVIGQFACWLFLILWIACVVFIALAIVGSFRGVREGHDQVMQGLVMTTIVSVAWIVVVYLFDSQLVGKIEELYGTSVGNVPASVIAPGVWVWVVAAMAVVGLVMLAVITRRLRAGDKPSAEDAEDGGSSPEQR